MSARKVVVTGIGVVSCAGEGIAAQAVATVRLEDPS